jgi:hypothetical protein
VPYSIPDTVLALQTLAFRYDWAEFYGAILADSALFVDALRRYRRGQGDDHFSFAMTAVTAMDGPSGSLVSGSSAQLDGFRSGTPPS